MPDPVRVIGVAAPVKVPKTAELTRRNSATRSSEASSAKATRSARPR